MGLRKYRGLRGLRGHKGLKGHLRRNFASLSERKMRKYKARTCKSRRRKISYVSVCCFKVLLKVVIDCRMFV